MNGYFQSMMCVICHYNDDTDNDSKMAVIDAHDLYLHDDDALLVHDE